MILDQWQQDVLNTPGNILLLSGRRVGKSEILSIDAAEYAAKNKNKSILVISHTERQAFWLFEKIIAHLIKHHPKVIIMKGKDKPTKTQCKLVNGTIIRCLPTGTTGNNLRGIPADIIYPDECDYLYSDIWPAITPMLLTTGGVIRASTTPKDMDGYVYTKMYKNPKFKVFEVSSQEVMENRPISESWTETQRKEALDHLEEERKTMTKLQYMREYMGQYVTSTLTLFSEALIKSCQQLERPTDILKAKYFMGNDIARFGGDSNTFEIFKRTSRELFEQVEHQAKEQQDLIKTAEDIIGLDKIYNFQKIGIDGAGVGAGVFDYLMRFSIGDKVEDLNNAKKAMDRVDERKKKLMKEEMYTNSLILMEAGKVKLLKDEDIFLSLSRITRDYDAKTGKMIIKGSFSHIAEGIVRAIYLASQDKSLNLWVRWS